MPEEPDKPKVELLANHKQLHMRCSASEFAALKKAACDLVGYAENVGSVDLIMLVNADRPTPEHRQPTKTIQLGCVIVAALVVFTMLFGLFKGIWELFSR